MRGIDQRRVGGLRGVVPLARGRFAAGVLRHRDDLEVLALQLFVKCLPAWQIKTAPSPGGPRHQQYLLAAELRETNGLAFAIGNFHVGRDT